MMNRQQVYKFLEILLAPYRMQITEKLVEHWFIALENVSEKESHVATRKLIQEPGRTHAPTPGELLVYVRAFRREQMLKGFREQLTPCEPNMEQIAAIKRKHPELFN